MVGKSSSKLTICFVLRGDSITAAGQQSGEFSFQIVSLTFTPDPGPNGAVIKTTASLICTSDVHIVRGVIPLPEGRGLGHESVGMVYKAGANVSRSKEGDRVAVCAITPCGHCAERQRGFSSQYSGALLGAITFEIQREMILDIIYPRQL